MAPVLTRLSSGGGFGFSKITVASSAAATAATVSRSLRFNSADSAYLSRTPASAGNRTTWTLSFWIKRANVSAYNSILSAGANYGANTKSEMWFDATGEFNVENRVSGSSNTNLKTTAVFRDPSAWYHFVISINGGTSAKIYVNGTEQTLTTNTVGSSDWSFNAATAHNVGRYAGGGGGEINAYLANIHFIDGYAYDASYFGQTNATTGVWDPIVYTGSYGSQGWFLNLADNSSTTSGSNAGIGKDTSGNGNYWNSSGLTVVNTGIYSNLASGTFDQGYYKPSNMWTSSGLSNTSNVQTANTTSSSGSYGTSVYFNLSSNSIPASSVDLWIIKDNNMGNYGVNIEINGTNITPSVLTTGYSWVGVTGLSSLTSIRIPAGAYCGGIRINGTVFVEGQTSDSLIDTPTNGSQTDTGLGGEVVGNYATLNPLEKGTNVTLSNGNLEATNSVAQNDLVKSTIGMSSGKWYAEFLVVSQNSPNATPRIGLSPRSAPVTNDDFGNAANEYAFGLTNNSSLYGRVYNNGSWNGTATAVYPNDIAMCAFDADTGKMWFGVNGTWFNSGNPAAGTNAWFTASMTEPYFFTVHNISTSTVCNFGQRPFAYTAPSGYKALCTANLPAPTIAKGSDYFDVSLYTGNGSTQTISGLNFEPDLVWWKNRTNGTIWHNLVDQVRGAGKKLFSNDTAAENTINLRGDLTAFTSTGFTMTAGSSDADNANATSVPYVAWCWDAGSSTVSNTAGSITSTVRANASAGFSVVTYTGNGTSGATIGHGLGVAPEFFIVKCRNTAATGWLVFAKPLGATSFLQLESTAAVASNATAWNNTAPSSTTITLGNSSFSNGNTQTYVCYAFAPVAGYSSFGSYTSNNSADGPFVYTDFKIRFLLVKLSSSAGNPWLIFDSARSTYNVVGNKLAPNSSVAEDDASIGTSTQNTVDFLSNGFKLRTSNEGTNGPTNTYIYAAFAEHPFAYARAR